MPKSLTASTTMGLDQKTLLYVAYPESNTSASTIIDNFESDTIELVPIIISTADGFDDYLLHNNCSADVFDKLATAIKNSVRGLMLYLQSRIGVFLLIR